MHHFVDVAKQLAYLFLQLNSAHYYGNGNAAGGGSQRVRKSGWNLGGTVGGGSCGMFQGGVEGFLWRGSNPGSITTTQLTLRPQ